MAREFGTASDDASAPLIGEWRLAMFGSVPAIAILVVIADESDPDAAPNPGRCCPGLRREAAGGGPARSQC